MPSTCDRHPTKAAWWRCPLCYKAFCPHCISKRESAYLNNDILYFCPRCNVETESLELSDVIPAFWTRLHKIIAYPFSSVHSIGLILVLSLLGVLILKLGFSLIMLAILSLPLIVWIKYCFESLRHTAEGHFKPPSLAGKIWEDDWMIVVKQAAMYGIIVGTLILLIIKFPFHAKLTTNSFSIFLTVAGPSMLLILIINDSLLQAMNPIVIVGVIFRIGWAYLLLLFFLFLLDLAPFYFLTPIVKTLPLPKEVILFIGFAAVMYYMLVSYHLMGYVVLQYHQRVGYPLDLETILASLYPQGETGPKNQSTPAANQPQHHGLLNEVALLIQGGEFEKALYQIEQQVEIEKIEDLELSQRYVGLLKMCKQHDKLLDYAPRYLELAAKSGAKSKALETYVQCLSLEKTFTAKPLVLFKIASWLNETDKNKEAIMALNSLVKSHPRDAMVPKAYYRAAKIFNEHLKNVEQAKKILNGLVRKFPDHEITSLAKSYLSGL